MKLIKDIIKKIPVFGEFARKLYSKINPSPVDRNSVTFWIDKVSKNKSFNVVQIGSNDGKTGDPIYDLIQDRKNWKALFVEPVPYLFERLKSNYPDKNRFTFENVAINDGSSQNFYWVDEAAKIAIEELPSWYDQLGSFNKENIIKHLEGRLEPFIISQMIEGITLSNLFERNQINKVDILHIDTEGNDWNILSQLDLKKYSPLIILFEHKHLSAQEKLNAVVFLHENYHVFEFNGDFLCLNKMSIKLSEKDIQYLAETYKISL